jgi:protein-S-isoprenylcysteine O-methyltransferase Ste14
MNIGTVLLAVSILWLGSEILLVRFRRSKSSETRRDSFTLWVLWIAIAVAVGGGRYFSSLSSGSFGAASDTSRVAGIILIVAGIAARWIAILTLKRHFTVDVAITNNHALVTHGIYRYLRHPAYSGTLLSFCGLGFAFANWISLMLIVVLVSLAFLHRIRVEEKVLLDQFGMEFKRYCSSTKRLIPFVF